MRRSLLYLPNLPQWQYGALTNLFYTGSPPGSSSDRQAGTAHESPDLFSGLQAHSFLSTEEKPIILSLGTNCTCYIANQKSLLIIKLPVLTCKNLGGGRHV